MCGALGFLKDNNIFRMSSEHVCICGESGIMSTQAPCIQHRISKVCTGSTCSFFHSSSGMWREPDVHPVLCMGTLAGSILTVSGLGTYDSTLHAHTCVHTLTGFFSLRNPRIPQNTVWKTLLYIRLLIKFLIVNFALEILSQSINSHSPTVPNNSLCPVTMQVRNLKNI